MTINKKDAIQIIKKYFEAAEINPRLRWEDASKQIGANAPEEAFKILSNGEKRQLWSEFQSQSRKRQREKERQVKYESIDKFNNCAKEWIIKEKNCNRVLKFRDFFLENFQHSWWKNIQNHEKDEIFQEAVEDYETSFFKEVEDKYKDNLNICEYFMINDPNIFPILNNKLKFTFTSKKDKSYTYLNADKLWEIINEKYRHENFFNNLYKNDVINIYIKLFKEKINTCRNQYKEIITRKLVKFRKKFWEIIKNDILLGIIQPISKFRKNYFILNSDNLNLTICDPILNSLKKKIIYDSKIEKKYAIFKDFLNFTFYHLNNNEDREIILFLLKQPFKDGKHIYCIEMFCYVLNYIQEFRDYVLTPFLKSIRRSEMEIKSHEDAKELVKKSTYYLKFRSEQVMPFSIESVLDKLINESLLEELNLSFKKDSKREFK